MDNEISGHLFVSYAHPDESDMLIFRKHLRGMLRHKVHVWSDQDISKGTDWDSLLKGNLNLANSALVLATPDYLISSWCRYELQQLWKAKRDGRLHNLFWVQLRPCGWQHTELAEFQAYGAEHAINESPDEMRRQRAILQACEQMAAELIRSTIDKDGDLAFVRRLLLDAPDIQNVTVNGVLHKGTFSIVCLGSNGSVNVAIKVLRWVPLEGLTKTLLRVGKARIALNDPSFLRTHKIFPVGPEREQRTIIISDYIENYTPLSAILSSDRNRRTTFSADLAAQLLRRMAIGLHELHKQKSDVEHEWERAIGLLTPYNIFYDQPAERLRISSIGVSTFLWHVLDCETYGQWVNTNTKVYIAPEQYEQPAGRSTHKTDQYMLGRLGVELLEGLVFEQILDGKAAKDFWNDPDRFIGGSWKNNHQQLWDMLKRMLNRYPEKRFKDMDEVAQRLQVLETEDRALAKSAYGAGKLHVEFFEEFYKTFFEVSPESKQKFESIDEKKQHEKLMMAMVAVLNYSPGNKPTSLDQILDKHLCEGITEGEFDKFQHSFVETLAMDRFKIQKEVRTAWGNLFKPVIEYMKSESTKRMNNGQERVCGAGKANDDWLASNKINVEGKSRRGRRNQ
ncbi:MAG TPA: TIR domain-containing protein [Xanthobacteraceae bacterium]|nr:TIR domain-containing protein [Xanthobacteraceae bacterium]